MSDAQETMQDAAADTASEGQAPAAEAPAPQTKTFTQAEVDAIIKRRIDKQNAKHGSEMESLTARIDELEKSAKAAEAERDRLRHESDLTAWKAAAADEFGVPQDILRGDTEEEVKAHAEAVRDAMGKSMRFPDSGNPAPRAQASSLDAFSKAMREALG